MKLSDLVEKSAIPLLEVEVVSWEEVVSYGEGGKMWPITVKDSSGVEAKLKLFGAQIDANAGKIEIGSKLRILKGWCSKIYEGKAEISTGKYGELFVMKE